MTALACVEYNTQLCSKLALREKKETPKTDYFPFCMRIIPRMIIIVVNQISLSTQLLFISYIGSIFFFNSLVLDSTVSQCGQAISTFSTLKV